MLLDSLPGERQRYGLKDTFRFACHRGLSCFNRCCRNKHLPLTPYDVLRLKRALGIHSDTFLVEYVVYSIDPASRFPVISLRMREDADCRCPFLGNDGCEVYDDRPTACRLFPLGRALGPRNEDGTREQFFFLQEMPECLGMREPRIWSVQAWLKDQGLLPYMAVNNQMAELLFHPARRDRSPLDERQLHKLIVACYNLDVFREIVMDRGLVDVPWLDEETRSRIQTDDTALLMFGFAYLRATLFR